MLLQGDKNLEFLERLNNTLNERCNQLSELLQEEREKNELLLDHIGIGRREDVAVQTFKPIGGYESLKKKARKLTIASIRRPENQEDEHPNYTPISEEEQRKISLSDRT